MAMLANEQVNMILENRACIAGVIAALNDLPEGLAEKPNIAAGKGPQAVLESGGGSPVELPYLPADWLNILSAMIQVA